MTDLVNQLRDRAYSSKVPDPLCEAAADEIASLRSMLQRQSESAHTALRLMGRYAEQTGFLEGGLWMVAKGHTTAEKVMASAEEKFGPRPHHK